jgi:uncharacterized membrane protein YdjX (TVP38/TMEM64 family)
MNVCRREVAGVAVLAAVVAASLATSPTAALAALAALGDRPLLFAALLVGTWVARPFLGWPTVAVSTAVGYVLGPLWGFPVAMLGVVVTSAPPFLAAGWFADCEGTDEPAGDGNRSADGLLASLGDHGRAYFRTTGDVRGVAAARLAPVPADAVSCAAGLSGVRPSAYALGTVVGELPWTVAAVVVGGSARRLTTTGLGEVGLPLLVATTVAAAVLLAGPAYRTLDGWAAGTE